MADTNDDTNNNSDDDDDFIINYIDEQQPDNDYLKGLKWEHHPLREFLLNLLIENKIPVDHTIMGPREVWDTYCDNPLFEGLKYGTTFTRRLLALRKQVGEGKSRADEDLEAFLAAKANHPPPARNHRGEPQWNGSEAQRLLAIDMEMEKNLDLDPWELWDSRDEYLEFKLTTFRSHIYQADRTKRYLHTRKAQANKKKEERKEKAAKKVELQKKKYLTEEEKKRKAEEAAKAKADKEAKKAADKAAKAAKKAADKANKEAKKAAARERRAVVYSVDPVSKLEGIGKKAKSVLAEMGITRIEQLLDQNIFTEEKKQQFISAVGGMTQSKLNGILESAAACPEKEN